MERDEKHIPDLAAMPSSAVLATRDAAAALGKTQQTLRKWACLECGPVRPVRINGRLAWRAGDLLALVNGGR